MGPVIVISGDADANAAAALDAAIETAAASHDLVIVDLNSATMVDSRTIGVLAGWVTKLRARGGNLPIVCADTNILRLFRTIGLTQWFDFYDSREQIETSPGSSA